MFENLFNEWVTERVSVAKKQRGLATRYHTAMVAFQKEVSKDDWLSQYAALTTKLEEKLEASLEDGEKLGKVYPEWRQYKSKYKQALKRGMNLSEYKTYSDFVINGLYGGNSDNGSGKGGSNGKGGGNPDNEDKVSSIFEAKLPESVAKQLTRLAGILATVPEEDALSVLSRTESILRGINKGNKKMGAVAAATK